MDSSLVWLVGVFWRTEQLLLFTQCSFACEHVCTYYATTDLHAKAFAWDKNVPAFSVLFWLGVQKKMCLDVWSERSMKAWTGCVEVCTWLMPVWITGGTHTKWNTLLAKNNNKKTRVFCMKPKRRRVFWSVGIAFFGCRTQISHSKSKRWFHNIQP